MDDAIARWKLSIRANLPAPAPIPCPACRIKSCPEERRRTWGPPVVEPENLRQLMIPEQQRLLETFTLLVASALAAPHPDRQRRAGPSDQRAGKPA